MVASSPIRHDMGLGVPGGPMGGGSGGPPGNGGMAGSDIQSYEPPWKALCDFALHSDLDKLTPAGTSQYQHLVHQVLQFRLCYIIYQSYVGALDLKFS